MNHDHFAAQVKDYILNLQDLPRVQFYGQFIRSISMKTGLKDGWIHPETIQQFTTAVQLLPLPLLPHLSTLEYDALREAYIAIGLWLNPHHHLTKLKLTLEGQRRADCLWVIRSIRHYSTSLVSLELRFHGGTLSRHEIQQCYADTLKSLCNLTQITADWYLIFAPSVWVCLAQLPKLEKVSSPQMSGRLIRTDWLLPPALAI